MGRGLTVSHTTLMSLLISTLAGCFGEQSILRQDSRANLSTSIESSFESGVTSGAFDPKLTQTQSLTVNEGDLAGSEARFPANALSISTQISIQEGLPIATSALAGSLSITAGFKATATPVAVTSSEKVDAVSPFIIAIPMPQTSGALRLFADAFENLVVTYVINVAATGETRIGTIPREALKIEKNKVAFETYYFGVYQAAITVERVTEERKATTTSFTVAAKSKQELPKLEITSRTPFVVRAGESVTLRGKNIRPTIRLALNGTPVPSLNLLADAVQFPAPSSGGVGMLKLTAEQDGVTQDVSLVYSGNGSYPVISEDKSKICSDVQFYDLNGTLQTGTRNCSGSSLADCNQDGQVNCKAGGMFIAVDKSKLSSGNIRKNISIGNVVGEYPSSAYPLVGSGGVTDLLEGIFEAQLRTSSAFKWFDSQGNMHTKSGDPDLQPMNLLAGVDIFGVSGTIVNCASDGQKDCIANSSFRAAKMASFSTWDIRYGKTIAGVTGMIVSSKNMTGSFDNTDSPASSGVDVWDTIDDYNNNFLFPVTPPSGWLAAMGGNWIMDAMNDSGVGGGTTGNNGCDGSEDCVFQDRYTGMKWTKDMGTRTSWADAITYCHELTYGGYNDWRLPTQKELMQAYINGIWSQKHPVKLSIVSTSSYWTATTQSSQTVEAWFVNLASGNAAAVEKSTSGFRAICVRE